MNVGALNIRFAEVNGTKENCCVQDLRKQKEPKPEISDFDSFFFCLMFSVTIFRPLTFARNYATIADRKRQIREVIFAGIFRNNRARKRIRTLIFHQGSYAHRLAEGEGFEPPEALTSTVFKFYSAFVVFRLLLLFSSPNCRKISVLTALLFDNSGFLLCFGIVSHSLALLIFSAFLTAFCRDFVDE